MHRHLGLALVLALAAVTAMASIGCFEASAPGIGPVAAPGGTGVCCSVDRSFEGCLAGGPVRVGGWAASATDCEAHVASGYDGPRWTRRTDGNGCEVIVQDFSAPLCGGAPPTDGGVAAGATSLSGSIPCGSTQCGAGELCVLYVPGHDAGRPSLPRCVPAQAGCTAFSDCSDFGATDCCGAAGLCARMLCGSPLDSDRCRAGGFGSVRVEGRDVVCAGI